jgi:hypothetical protein
MAGSDPAAATEELPHRNGTWVSISAPAWLAIIRGQNQLICSCSGAPMAAAASSKYSAIWPLGDWIEHLARTSAGIADSE